jgi:hypothetical protein
MGQSTSRQRHFANVVTRLLFLFNDLVLVGVVDSGKRSGAKAVTATCRLQPDSIKLHLVFFAQSIALVYCGRVGHESGAPATIFYSGACAHPQLIRSPQTSLWKHSNVFTGFTHCIKTLMESASCPHEMSTITTQLSTVAILGNGVTVRWRMFSATWLMGWRENLRAMTGVL